MKPTRRLRRFLAALGPGLVTGAADDDPSGIGTYAQAGAQFGYQFLWTAAFTFPLMLVVQEMCARVGMTTGRGLAAVIKRHYGRAVLYLAVLLLVGANVVNVGADILGMAAAAALLVPASERVLAVAFTVASTGLAIFLDYRAYARYLKWLTLSLFAYVAEGFVIRLPWREIAGYALLPHAGFGAGRANMLVAILGTTISPYLFFWIASQEVEDEVSKGRTTIGERVGCTADELRHMRTDVTSGMVFSNVIMFFIIAATAATLGAHGVRDIQTAAQAAEALRPVAGRFAVLLFTLGIIGTGLMAVPILAASAAYAVAELLGWREGLSLKPRVTTRFYRLLAGTMGAGFLLAFLPVSPMKALVYTAVLNGLAAPPLVALVILMCNDPAIVGTSVNGPFRNLIGWVTCAAMAAGAFFVIADLVRSW